MRFFRLPLRFSVLLILLSTAFFCPTSFVASAIILHVTPDGIANGNCSDNSWSNPCSLQNALSIAQPGDEIWVKGGTYRPTADGNKEVSFPLKNGVAVYGGFAGDEDSRADRRWRVHVTTLSGDLMQNDSGSARWDNPTYSDNSFHVVTADGVSNSAILEGFTISGGNAEGGSFGRFPTSGGGISLVNSSPIFMNLIVVGNTSHDSGNGGGLLLNDGECHPWLTNVLFSGNQAGAEGGAVYNYEGSPVLTNVTISGNQAGSDAGGIFTRNGTMLIRNSILWGNSSPTYPSINTAITFLKITYSDVQGGCPTGGPPGTCDSTDLYIDPHFINAKGLDGIYGTPDDNPRLQKTSLLINQGNNNVDSPSLPKMDLDGFSRIIQGIVDIGAYEQQFNQPPISNNQTFMTFGNRPLAAQLQASDADGDLLTFQLMGDAPPGTLDLHQDGSFLYTSISNSADTVYFQFEVMDAFNIPIGPYTATIQIRYPLYLPAIQR